MLIRSLRAENFMRFSRLRLENLPQRGIVAVEGPNESGKSTVGEAILFALFGRTRFSKDCPLEHLIHWGSEYLRVEAEFTIFPDGRAPESYLILREIDRAGTNYVKLLSLPERLEVATGNLEVSNLLGKLLRFDFFEFQQAFYHDQYDSRVVDSTLGPFLDRVTGVYHMNKAAESIKKEIEQLEREFAHYQQDISRNLRQIEKYSKSEGRLLDLRPQADKALAELEQGKARASEQESVLGLLRQFAAQVESTERKLKELPRLRSDRLAARVDEILSALESTQALLVGPAAALSRQSGEAHRSVREGLRRLQALLEEHADLRRSFREARDGLDAELSEGADDSLVVRQRQAQGELDGIERRCRRVRRQLGVVAVLTLASAALSLAGWLAPASTHRWLPPGVEAAWLALGAGLAAFALLLFEVWRVSTLVSLRSQSRGAKARMVELDAKIASVRKEIQDLDELDALAESGTLEEYVHRGRRCARGSLARKVAAFEECAKGVLGSGGSGDIDRVLVSLAEAESGGWKRLQSSLQAEEKKLRDLEAAMKKARSDRDRIENEIRDCQGQHAKKEAFEDRNRELAGAAGPIREQIEDRRLACDLLEDAARSTRRKIGPTVGRFLRGIFPQVSGGRYRDVKINDGVDVWVYSEEKCDFVSHGELSGGTNEALMLALRLAFSQVLVSARSRQPQFVFLDEPFKMMDLDRVLAALRTLPRLSKELVQFFVVQPRYSEAQRLRFDGVIQPSVDSSDLEYVCDIEALSSAATGGS
jgi:hypothetical protein